MSLQQRITGQYQYKKIMKIQIINLIESHLDLLRLTPALIFVKYKKNFNDTREILLTILNMENIDSQDIEVGRTYIEKLKKTLRNHKESKWYEFWK